MKHAFVLLMALCCLNLLHAQNFWEKVEMPEPGNMKDILTDKDNNLYVACQNGLFIKKNNTSQWNIIAKQHYGYKFLFKIGEKIITTESNVAYEVNSELNKVIQLAATQKMQFVSLLLKKTTYW